MELHIVTAVNLFIVLSHLAISPSWTKYGMDVTSFDLFMVRTPFFVFAFFFAAYNPVPTVVRDGLVETPRIPVWGCVMSTNNISTYTNHVIIMCSLYADFPYKYRILEVS